MRRLLVIALGIVAVVLLWRPWRRFGSQKPVYTSPIGTPGSVFEPRTRSFAPAAVLPLGEAALQASDAPPALGSAPHVEPSDLLSDDPSREEALTDEVIDEFVPGAEEARPTPTNAELDALFDDQPPADEALSDEIVTDELASPVAEGTLPVAEELAEATPGEPAEAEDDAQPVAEEAAEATLGEPDEAENALEVPAKPDALILIEGIGPKISTIIAAAGITSFAQLAATEVEHLRTILVEAGIPTANPSTWPEQARIAATGNMRELSAFQQRIKYGKLEE